MVKAKKHDRFYMGFVVIQVENCLFRLPRQPLESQSRLFQDMFSLPVSGNAEGSSDSNPIRLEGITLDKFERFLEVLFYGGVAKTVDPIFDAWIPVVKLARMWEFDAVHQYAIERMPYQQINKSPAEKVRLAVQYDIRPWLLPGVNELAQRKEPLGNEDLAFLGAELALRVAAIRESLAIDFSDCNYYGGQPKLTCGSRDATMVDFAPAIKDAFHI